MPAPSRRRAALLAAVLAVPPAVAWNAVGTHTGPPVPSAETPARFDDEAGGDADADDPAVWIGRRTADSIVIGTLKNAGLEVYDLDGKVLQAIPPPPAPSDDAAPGRFNNVDVLQGVRIGGRRADLAIVTDRGRDRLRIHRIDRWSKDGPLIDVTVADPPRVFSADEAEVDDQATAYGVAAWRTPWGDAYVAVSRRSRTTVALYRLRAADGGRVTYERLDDLDLPREFTLPDGTAWVPCTDPGDDPQVEGMTFDVKRGILFAGQEDVGIWRIPVQAKGLGTPVLFERVREYGVPYTYDADEEECVLSDDDPGFGGTTISADVEGLTIYYGPRGSGYLLASSQGDDTFAVFSRRGLGPLVGTFTIADGPGELDGVQESDGAQVVNLPLGRRYPHGLLVVHDGDNTPEVLDDEGEARENTNFKLVRWERVARSLTPRLAIHPRGYDPR